MMFFTKKRFPVAINAAKVGKYPDIVFSGGGYFYDDVLEYRVWVPEESSYYPFATYEEAKEFSKHKKGAEKPLVLVRQNEYIAEDDEGNKKHIKKRRITEWQVDWLKGTQGTVENIPKFLGKE